MRFGVREICDVVFKPLSSVDIGNQHFDVGQPVLYLDTAKTSTLEGASTTVYAQGGKGNPRLIGWDGEKTITFTVEDALMSPISFAMLSGAGVIKGHGSIGDEDAEKIFVHTFYDLVVEKENDKFVAKLTDVERNGATLVVSKEAPVYPILLDSAGAQAGYLSAVTDQQIEVDGEPYTVPADGILEETAGKTITFVLATDEDGDDRLDSEEVISVGQGVRIDCYTVHTEGAYEMQIDAATFAGYYYIEASTLFRDEATGVDLAAEFIIPRGKIQSNFTFTMANSGDPSTFTFTIDAFPAYTKFNKNKKVMAVLQVIDAEGEAHNYGNEAIMGHKNRKGDEDVDKWYKASVFGGDASFNEGIEPTPEVTIDITASIASNVNIGDYYADNGFTGSMSQSGDNFIVTGEFTDMKGQDTDLAFPVDEATGYYLPVEFTGTTGTVIQRVGKSKTNVIGSTGDGADKAIIILYVEQSNPVINMTEEGKPFTIDCSACSFN